MHRVASSNHPITIFHLHAIFHPSFPLRPILSVIRPHSLDHAFPSRFSTFRKSGMREREKEKERKRKRERTSDDTVEYGSRDENRVSFGYRVAFRARFFPTSHCDCPRNPFFPTPLDASSSPLHPSSALFSRRLMDRRFVLVKLELWLPLISGWFFSCIRLQAPTWKPYISEVVEDNIVFCSRIWHTRKVIAISEKELFTKRDPIFFISQMSKNLFGYSARYLWTEYATEYATVC